MKKSPLWMLANMKAASELQRKFQEIKAAKLEATDGPARCPVCMFDIIPGVLAITCHGLTFDTWECLIAYEEKQGGQ